MEQILRDGKASQQKQWKKEKTEFGGDSKDHRSDRGEIEVELSVMGSKNGEALH